ncbi:MAG: hypothetical protein K5764_07205 [Prevotella sp.]|nr:hypothetical protein [Prevotella sp.]
MPTGIGKNEEQMENLAEMLYAIVRPSAWQKAIDNEPAPGFFTSGTPMFHDFRRKYKEYHNQFFWQRVQDAWREQKLVETLFGFEYDKFEGWFQLGGVGLHFLVSDFSWWESISNMLTLYEYNYQATMEDLNMHHVTHQDVKQDITRFGMAINIEKDNTLTMNPIPSKARTNGPGRRRT